MILRGLTVHELKSALEDTQEMYGNNLEFNNFEIKTHMSDVKGLGAIDMSGVVIIGKEDGRGFTINISKPLGDFQLFPNPFIDGQFYYIQNLRDEYKVLTYDSPDKEIIQCRDMKMTKTPLGVLDFLKNNLNAKTISFTLKVKDSKKPGHRLGFPQYSLNGGDGKQRRLASACWHVHRDVMKAIFEINPNASLKTVLTHYKNKDDFYEKFEETGYRNIGSDMFPAYASDLCECNG